MSAVPGDAPVCDIDFYAPSTIADPASAYATMLGFGPVVWLNKNNIHAICGHTELVAALRNHECFQSGKGVSIDESVNKLLIGSTLHSDHHNMTPHAKSLLHLCHRSRFVMCVIVLIYRRSNSLKM